MKAILISVGCLAISGCAGIDCGADAFALGQRDGRLGASLESQTMIYGERCAAPIDQSRYADGWRDGFRARPIPLW